MSIISLPSVSHPLTSPSKHTKGHSQGLPWQSLVMVQTWRIYSRPPTLAHLCLPCVPQTQPLCLSFFPSIVLVAILLLSTDLSTGHRFPFIFPFLIWAVFFLLSCQFSFRFLCFSFSSSIVSGARCESWYGSDFPLICSRPALLFLVCYLALVSLSFTPARVS